MNDPHYTATQADNGKWFFTWPTVGWFHAGKSSGWKHQGQCQQQADKAKAMHHGKESSPPRAAGPRVA